MRGRAKSTRPCRDIDRLADQARIARADLARRSGEALVERRERFAVVGAAVAYRNRASPALPAAQADPAATVDALVRQRPEQARNREQLVRQLQLSLQAASTPNTKGLPFGVSSEKDWQAMVDQFVQSGQIASPVPTSTLYTNDYNKD